jgi:spoIIIJ-associated protein
MESMEFEGKTTEEAIENASRFLEIPVEDLNIDILEPGSAGIFGLVGIKKAKIKVSYVPLDEQSEEDQSLREFESVPQPEIDEEDLDDDDFPDEDPEDEADSASESDVLEPAREEELAFAKEVLETILRLFPMEAEVTVRWRDGNVNLNIQGDNSGLLIGRRGKTLDAIQFIVNKIVNKSLERKVRVVVDSEHYRGRRRESLTQLATRMGEKAKRIRKPVTTNPMNPGDRRIVHLALKDDSELDTRSRGEGLMKKVVIIPRR